MINVATNSPSLASAKSHCHSETVRPSDVGPYLAAARHRQARLRESGRQMDRRARLVARLVRTRAQRNVRVGVNDEAVGQ